MSQFWYTIRHECVYSVTAYYQTVYDYYDSMSQFLHTIRCECVYGVTVYYQTAYEVVNDFCVIFNVNIYTSGLSTY